MVRVRFHKPLPVPPSVLDGALGGVDPIDVAEAAHRTAEVVVGRGRASADPAVTARLVGLVRELGLATVAELWADRPARSLPGALWRLYLLHEWVQQQPAEVARAFTEGSRYAEVYRVIAGVSEPPHPEDLQELTGAILAGVFDGDLATALDRAAAFCHVVAVGLAGPDGGDVPPGQVRRASRLQATARDLQVSADLWRRGDLT